MNPLKSTRGKQLILCPLSFSFNTGVGNLRPSGRIRPARPFDTALYVIYKHTQKEWKKKKKKRVPVFPGQGQGPWTQHKPITCHHVVCVSSDGGAVLPESTGTPLQKLQ